MWDSEETEKEKNQWNDDDDIISHKTRQLVAQTAI